MKYARIDLSQTDYSPIIEMKFIVNPNVSMIGSLQAIYEKYCRYKQFNSVMPIFDSEFTDPKNDVFGYYILKLNAHTIKINSISICTLEVPMNINNK